MEAAMEMFQLGTPSKTFTAQLQGVCFQLVAASGFIFTELSLYSTLHGAAPSQWFTKMMGGKIGPFLSNMELL